MSALRVSRTAFAVVPGFGDGQHFEIGFDAIGNLQQHQRAVLDRSLAPGIGGGMGVQGLVDIFGTGAREFGNRRPLTGEVVVKYWPLTGATNSPPM